VRHKFAWENIQGQFAQADMPGGMFLMEYPQRKSDVNIYPYCVVSLTGDVADYTFRDKIYKLTIQFTLYDDSDIPETILDAGDVLRDKYNDIQFPSQINIENFHFVAYEFVAMNYISSSFIKQGDYWQYAIVFSYEYQRTVA
jgi:hypothetical protein